MLGWEGAYFVHSSDSDLATCGGHESCRSQDPDMQSSLDQIQWEFPVNVEHSEQQVPPSYAEVTASASGGGVCMLLIIPQTFFDKAPVAILSALLHSLRSVMSYSNPGTFTQTHCKLQNTLHVCV